MTFMGMATAVAIRSGASNAMRLGTSSPMTMVTFDIVAGAAARSAGGRALADGMARTNRPFESPVLDVTVISGNDGHAATLLALMTAVVGNQVPQERENIGTTSSTRF